MYNLSMYIESVLICLAYNTVCAAPCGAVMLPNRFPKAFTEREKSCFLLRFKVTFSPYQHFILLKYPDKVTPLHLSHGG